MSLEILNFSSYFVIIDDKCGKRDAVIAEERKQFQSEITILNE